MTRDQALTLPLGTVLHHISQTGTDRQPVRCRVNGRCRTWKTRPDDFQLPVKYGLKTCFYITPANAHEWTLPETSNV